MLPQPADIKKAFIAGCLTFLFFFAEAQTLKDYLAKGDRDYHRKDFENALKNYLAALELDADDALTNLRVGLSYLNEEGFSRAVTYLQKAYDLNPSVDTNIDYHLGMAYQGDQQYSRALKHYKVLKSKNKNLAPVATQKIRECLLADSLMRMPVDATVQPLHDGINTLFAEVSPLISADGKTLIFTSNRSEDDYQIKSATNFYDVYISRREGSGWSHPQKISSAINVKLSDAATSLSSDGKTLFLYYEDSGGDIYTSTLENGEWTKPVALNRFINHPNYRESAACVSADGKKLFFSSNRAGGRGGYDIYVSELGANGQWGRPSNLGSTINTRRDEDRPFLHADGLTLYFSSNGHATLGKSDIFKSTLQDGKWGRPHNLGHPINTTGDDGYFVLSPDGKTGYYSRLQGNGSRNTDIFSVDFTGMQRVAKRTTNGQSSGSSHSISEDQKIVTILKGTVIDVNNASPLEATITLVNNTHKKIVSTIETGPSGNFELIIPHGGNYGVITEKHGYLFNSMNFSLPAFQKYQEIDTHILMVKAEVGSKVVLKNIFFDTNQSILKGESLTELENIRDLLLQNPDWRIQINGHTDNVGHPQINLALSLKRAEAVVKYLASQGISAERLEAKGYGSERPLVSNDDEKEGRQINRRTEIEIIE
ncbi:MAG: OmpA family protein [Cyclobacteriaceae bacterium]